MKQHNSLKKLIYFLCISIIITVSYFTVSPIYSGYFNSDTAVPILQAADFDFLHDLYYWGQKRLGSLIPMLGFILHKVTSIPPLYTTTIVNYLFLVLCFFIFSTFLKSFVERDTCDNRFIFKLLLINKIYKLC